MMKLPSFPNAEKELLDEVLLAFQKVIGHAAEIAAQTSREEVVA